MVWAVRDAYRKASLGEDPYAPRQPGAPKMLWREKRIELIPICRIPITDEIRFWPRLHPCTQKRTNPCDTCHTGRTAAWALYCVLILQWTRTHPRICHRHCHLNLPPSIETHSPYPTWHHHHGNSDRIGPVAGLAAGHPSSLRSSSWQRRRSCGILCGQGCGRVPGGHRHPSARLAAQFTHGHPGQHERELHQQLAQLDSHQRP